MTDTSLGTAMKAAGLETARDRVLRIAAQAKEAHPRAFEQQWEEFVRQLSEDPHALIEALKDFRYMIARQWLKVELNPARPGFSDKRQPPASAKDSVAARAALGAVIRNSRLSVMTELGKTVGECTGADAITLRDRGRVQYAFWAPIAAALRPDEKVAERYDEDAAARLWHSAEGAGHAHA